MASAYKGNVTIVSIAHDFTIKKMLVCIPLLF